MNVCILFHYVYTDICAARGPHVNGVRVFSAQADDRDGAPI